MCKNPRHFAIAEVIFSVNAEQSVGHLKNRQIVRYKATMYSNERKIRPYMRTANN